MKGILFKTDMIKAIAEGRKTQTRRRIDIDQLQWIYKGIPYGMAQFDHKESHERITFRPKYQVGEVMYIKEAWTDLWCVHPQDISQVVYKKDYPPAINFKWKSLLFMPAWAARYFIQITDVRAERLQSITEEDAELEGFNYWEYDNPNAYADCPCTNQFIKKWDSVNPKHPWASNPWCFVYSFKEVSHDNTSGEK